MTSKGEEDEEHEEDEIEGDQKGGEAEPDTQGSESKRVNRNKTDKGRGQE